MTVIVCPLPLAETLHPEWSVPHHGFGITSLERNGAIVWYSLNPEECDEVNLRQLAEWCDSAARWTIRADGPMLGAIYELCRIWRLPGFVEWRLIETLRGFA